MDTIDGLAVEHLAEAQLPATSGASRVEPSIAGVPTDAAFGAPVVVGERTIIPVCRVKYGPDGRTKVTPVGVVEVTARKTRYVPIVDPLALIARVFAFVAVISVAGILFGSESRSARRARRRALRPLAG